MAEVKKKLRSNRLSFFTRKLNNLQGLLNEFAPAEGVDESYKNLVDAFEKLEVAHEDYADHVDTDIDSEENYMNDPCEKYDKLQILYYKFKKGTEKERLDTEEKRRLDQKKERCSVSKISRRR